MALESRPFSRRGQSDRPPSALGMESSRPQTSSMKGVATMRPPSVAGQIAISTTASRINTGLTMPPKTVFMSGNESLSGLRTATAQKQRRQVLDKRYYEGLIRQKIKVVNQEIHRLSELVAFQQQQEVAAQVYNTQVKETAQEVTNLQGELMDYNQVLGRIQTGQDIIEAVMELEQAKSDNSRDTARIDQLYQQNQLLQQQLAHVETQIQNEKNVTIKMLEEMDDATRERYQQLKVENDGLLTELSTERLHLEKLNTHISGLHDELSTSQIKQEAVLLHQKLRDRQEKKEQLIEEEKQKGTPAQEREQLLQRVRDDNAEMGAMERQIVQITQQISTVRQEIEIAEQDLEESSSDRHQKLKELRQREETMEFFLSNYEDARSTEQGKIETLEMKVEIALKQMIETIKYPSTIRQGAMEFAIMKEDIEMVDDMEKSKLSTEELAEKENKLATNVKIIKELHTKIMKEIENLKHQNDTMSRDMLVYADLNSLRTASQLKNDEMTKKRDALINREKPTDKLRYLRERHDQLLKQLGDNDTYVQINTLEKKLTWIEETNATLLVQLTSKKVQLNIDESRSQTMNLINNYNALIKKRY